MELDRETMGFVAHRLHELERGGRVVENHRLLTTANVEDLLPLGQAREGKLAEAEFVERLRRRAELAETAVDENEVGQVRALFQQPPIAPSHHFAHGREVVGRAHHGLDLERPVVGLLGRRHLEDHHRGHDVRPLQVRDVEALDPPRLVGQAERLHEGDENFARTLLRMTPFQIMGELGVAGDEFEQTDLLAALGHAESHLGAPPFAEPGGQSVHSLEGLGHQDLARHVAIVLVETRDRLFENAVLVAHPVEKETLARRHPAVPHAEDLQRRATLFDVNAEDVAFVGLGGGDLLRHLEAFEGLDGITHGGRVFEKLLFGRLVHAGAQVLQDLVGAAFEELRGIGARLAVVVERTDRRDAGRLAPVNLKLKAGTRAMAVELLATRAHAEDAVHQGRGLPPDVGRDVRPAIGALVLGHLAHDVEARIRLAERQLQIGVVLVVTKEDVVERLVALDEVVLERQRLAFAVGDEDVQVGDLRHHRDLVERPLVPGLEVGAHAGLEHPRLADVDDRSPGVLEQVDAGRGRKLLELRLPFAQRDVVRPFLHGLWIVP